jgi:NDP-sugar pyrophosphorylase family protein
MPRGPAGCLRDASELTDAEEYVVVEGFILPSVDLRAVLSAHRRSGAVATIVVHGERHNETASWRESAPVGVYVFSRHAVSRISPSSYQDIKETLIPGLLRDGATVVVCPADEPSPRVWDLATFLGVQPWALARARDHGDLHSRYMWRGTTAVHPTAWMAKSARAIGPAMIGAGTHVGERALLIGPVVVGSECRLGESVLVGNSVICDGAVLEPESRVDSCVIAVGASVRARMRLRDVIWRGSRARRHTVLPVS